MGKLTKDFFTGNEVLFVGYSSRQKGFCNMVAKAFARNGITAYPLNTKSKGPFPIKVYASLKEIPKLPQQPTSSQIRKTPDKPSKT